MTDYNIPVEKQGPAIVIDTTLKSSDAMFIDEMSGDLGDAGRKIYLAIKERAMNNDPKSPLKPMDLTGLDIRFQGHDSKGVFKRIALATKIDNAQAGLAQITLPRFIYQAVGPYENGEFEIYEKNGDTVISTVPVAFEVYNNHAHMTIGDSQVYSDEFEALMQAFKKSSTKEIDGFNERMSTLLQQTSTAQNSAEGLKILLNDLTKLIENKSVALLNADNVFTGNITVEKPLKAYATGTSVRFFNNAHTRQDLNDETAIKNIPSFSQSLTYYSGNKLLNNPMSSDLVLVETTKISTMTAFQTAISQDMGKGEIKKRIIKNIDAGIQLGEWSTVERWGPWMSLIPYLTKEWMSKNKDYYLPEYRYKGDSIQLRGVIGTKGTIKAPQNHYDRIPIANNLPFMGTTAIYHSAIWSGRHPYTLRIEGNEMFMERVYDSDHQLTDIDNSMMFTLSGTFPIDK